ncbi:MAG: hypothetical protein LBI30_01055 [Holosporales bacterium]|jgi:hypothetical protein|nr:hypothetical protein [Holosporales bacterium]
MAKGKKPNILEVRNYPRSFISFVLKKTPSKSVSGAYAFSRHHHYQVALFHFLQEDERKGIFLQKMGCEKGYAVCIH